MTGAHRPVAAGGRARRPIRPRRLSTHLACLILVLPVLLAACGGGGASLESQSDIRTTTIGREWLDLNVALDAGAITEAEYAEQRARILEGE